jgi:hypothetical protein
MTLSSAVLCVLLCACGGGVVEDTEDPTGDLNPPSVDTVHPSEGDAAGGTLVTVIGTGFFEGVTGETVVRFGEVGALEATVISDFTILCLTPGGTVGEIVDLTVINSRGTGSLEAAFTYIDGSLDDPQIASIDPESGDPAGGTEVTITGSQFTEVDPGETTVTFGGLEASGVIVLDDSTIICTSPPGVDGDTVLVMVLNPRGTAEFDGFTYADTSDDPVVSSVDPSVDLPAGGVAVTITGSQFTEVEQGETVVHFGEVQALDAVVVDDETILCSAPAGLDNTTVDIFVSNPRGEGVLEDAFSYLDPSDDPILDSIDPSEGAAEGGETITLSGQQFTEVVVGETSVMFGANAATDVEVLNDNTIRCTAPVGDLGATVSVSVVNPRGTATLEDAYLYIDPAADDPVITAIDPSQGEPAGGTSVTIVGSQFSEESVGETSVDFGGVPATEVVVEDDTSITCLSPAGVDGTTVDVTVSNPRGDAVFSGFSYIDTSDDPVISAVDPSLGLPAGGTAVTISGERFTEVVAGETSVLFGGVAASNVVVVDDATITCDSPAGSDNTTVDVAVSNPRGADVLEGAFSYIDPSDDPSIVSIDPMEGDYQGGTLVTIFGSLFTETTLGETSVLFGGVAAANIVVVDDATITCTSPPGEAGDTVVVSVVNPRGTASITGFTYTGGGPELLSFDALEGDEDGGELVTLTGQRFAAANAGETTVSFGGAPATSVVVVDDVTITCLSPVGEGGTSVDVAVLNALGSSSLCCFTFLVDEDSDEGDLDGDGLMDLVVGAPMDDSNGLNAGSVHVFLAAGSLASGSDLVASNADVILVGVDAQGRFGAAVATADLNDDGDEDLIVGAPGAGGGGAVYIFNGPLVPGSMSADDADHVIWGEGVDASESRVSDRFGQTICVRDTDGDGAVDLIVGAPGKDADVAGPLETADVGAVYIVSGGAGMAASAAASGAGVILMGENPGDLFGTAAGLGDFNADGEVDLFVGAPGASTQMPSAHWDGGAVFLWLGPLSTSGSTSDSDASYYMLDQSSAMGSAIEVGDIDGDGYDDLVTSAPFADSEVAIGAGLCLVFRGDVVVFSENATSADIILHGMSAEGGFGECLLVEDLTGDGVDDIVATAASDSYGATRNGRAFLFEGGPTLGDTWAIAAGAIFTGRFREFEHFGVSAGALDLDGDGELDLCVSARGGEASSPGAGSVHVFLSGGGLLDRDADSDDLTLEGEQLLDRFGAGLSSPE